jgi:hypothetical protein
VDVNIIEFLLKSCPVKEAEKPCKSKSRMGTHPSKVQGK